MNNFGYTKEVFSSFDEALDDTVIALGEEGFGVLSKINMKDKLNEKLGIHIEEYIVLGACNPSLAHNALEIEYEIGLLLPCNVIVYKKDGKVFVSTIVPTVAMNFIDNEKFNEITKNTEEKLKKVIDSI